MRLSSLLFFLSAVAATTFPAGRSALGRRADVCSDLSVSSNLGDRKVAIVIDSSGSMYYNDPSDLRLAAGKALNDFLVSNSEASGSKKADQVAVIDFDDEAYIDYPMGDPGNAGSSFDKIDASGGTYIAEGVRTAISQIQSGSGTTDKRSAIVVFTDGEDSSTQELIDAINNATDLGIRVSFGFLDTSASSQPTKVLQAIRASRGVYATITLAAGSINYINYVILNGLTYNDNPQGYDAQLLSGLAETHLISGSSTVTLKYNAQQGEKVNFTITSITSGSLTSVAQMNGQTLQSSTTGTRISVTAPSTGEMQLLITANNAATDSLFSVTTNSNVPIKNCTVGVAGEGGDNGLSTGAKAGIGVGVTAGVLGLLSLGGYYAWKQWSASHPATGGTNAPMADGTNAPMAGGQGTMAGFDPGAEKMMAHADVHPMSTPPLGQAPLNSVPPGQAPLYSMPPSQAPLSTMPQAPMSGVPVDGGQSMMQAVPPGAPPTASYNPPLAIAPPGLPPNLSKPGNQSKEGDEEPMDQKAQHTMGPDSFQHSMPSHDGLDSPYGQPLSPLSQSSQHPLVPNGFQSPMVSPNSTGVSDPSMFQHPLGPDQFQHGMSPDQFQHGMSPDQFQHGMSPDQFQHGMSPGGGQYVMPPPASQMPIGADGFQHTIPPGGPGVVQHPLGPGYQGSMSPNSFQQVVPPGGAQHPLGPGYQGSMSPDSIQHTMTPDSYNHSMSPSSSNQPMSTAGSQAPMGTSDTTSITPSKTASPPGPSFHPPGTEATGGTQSGFTMPGVQMRQGGKEKKHHHHAWLAPDTACEHPECPLVSPSHECSPNKETCPCSCRDQGCPVTRRNLGGSTI